MCGSRFGGKSSGFCFESFLKYVKIKSRNVVVMRPRINLNDSCDAEVKLMTRLLESSQYFSSISTPVSFLLFCAATMTVMPLSLKRAENYIPNITKHFDTSSRNLWWKWRRMPDFFSLLSLSVKTPFVHSINSAFVMSDTSLPPVFLHCFLYNTTINSTDIITNGAEALHPGTPRGSTGYISFIQNNS